MPPHKIQEIDGGDDCATLQMYLIPLKCTPKMGGGEGQRGQGEGSSQETYIKDPC